MTVKEPAIDWRRGKFDIMSFYYAGSTREDARVVIVGMPLDRSSSFVPGTRFGPDAIRIGADNIESFSPYQRRDVSETACYDAGNLAFSWPSPTAPLDAIRGVTDSNCRLGKRQLALGGEHTITPAIISGLLPHVPELCVMQYDAHSDLRPEYLGEEWCHATAMARVLDIVPRDRLLQVGIRSFADAAEMDDPNVIAMDVASAGEIAAARFGTRPVYVTLDVDVLDPSTLPDVQTPQPGGCTYRELARSLAALAKLNTVGADIVEFCPRGPHPTFGSSVVAELVRELALLLDS